MFRRVNATRPLSYVFNFGPSSCLLAADAANTSGSSFQSPRRFNSVGFQSRTNHLSDHRSFLFFFLAIDHPFGDFPVIGWFCWRSIFFIILRSCVISYGSMGLILGIQFLNFCFSCEICKNVILLVFRVS